MSAPAYNPALLPVPATTIGAPLETRAVHLADRLQLDWSEFLLMLDLIERYRTAQGNGAPPPTAL